MDVANIQVDQSSQGADCSEGGVEDEVVARGGVASRKSYFDLVRVWELSVGMRTKEPLPRAIWAIIKARVITLHTP